MKDTNLITNILGGMGAIAIGAQPVMNGITPDSSMHQGDWLQLVFAVIVAAMGYFTNKAGKT